MFRKLRRFDDNDEGMLSLVNLFIVLGFLILFSAVANVGRTVGRKLETQNAADAVAASAGIEMARGMNAIATANHLIGELTALVVLHHSLGGDELDSGTPPTQSEAESTTAEALKIAFQYANTATMVAGPKPDPQGYQRASQPSRVGASIRDSRLRLRQVMTWAYVTHAVGGVFNTLGQFPIPGVAPALRSVGTTTMNQAIVFENKVDIEWVILDTLENLAGTPILDIKLALRDAAIPALYNYTLQTMVRTPTAMTIVADGIGRNYDADGTLFPSPTTVAPLALPVIPESNRLTDDRKSQLVRATTPWVQYWRLPMFRFAEDALLLARFKNFYRTQTDDWTLRICRPAKNPMRLLMLQDVDLVKSDKTFEPWTLADGSALADQRFAVVGFARKSPAKVSSFGIFRQGNPDGIVAYAQQMIYNGNPQHRNSGTPTQQPIAGWDTLDWSNRVPEYPGPGLMGPNSIIVEVPEPRIRPNWQSKLVPTTRLAESTQWQRGELGEVLRRTASGLNLAGTH